MLVVELWFVPMGLKSVMQKFRFHLIVLALGCSSLVAACSTTEHVRNDTSGKGIDAGDSVRSYGEALREASDLNYRGKFSEADAVLTQAIAINKSDPSAFTMRGRVRGRLGQFAAALSDHETAIKMMPSYWGFVYAKGQTEEAAGHLQLAENDYTLAIQLGGKIDPLLYRGRIAMKQGRLTEALKDINTYIESCKRCPEALYYRALVLLQQGQSSRARKDLIQAQHLCQKFMYEERSPLSPWDLEDLVTGIDAELVKLRSSEPQ